MSLYRLMSAAAAVVILFAKTTTSSMAGEILFVSTSGNQSTTSSVWTPIPGLFFTLPPKTPNGKYALIILNIPNPYALGSNYPGGTFGIAVNNAVLIPIAEFTTNVQSPPGGERSPTTLVVRIPLTKQTQDITGVWENVRNSTVIMDTPSSMSAVIQ